MDYDDDLMFHLGEVLVPRAWDGGFCSLNPHEKIFVCVWELEASMNGGGFAQYFIDSAGDHSAEAVLALREIGAKRMAKLVEQAIATFPGGTPPAEQEARDVLLLERAEQLEPALAKLDDKYLAYPEDVSDLLSSYVAFHRKHYPDAKSLS